MSNPITSTPPENTPPPLNFGAVLRQMLKSSDKVSDLIFSPGRPPQIELAGKLQPVQIPGLEKLTPAHTAGMAKVIIGAHQTAAESIEKTGSADLSFSAPGEARFRVNIFKQRGSHAIVMRVIPTHPPNFADFDLPSQLKEIVDIKNGIVLVTGPTGSGKSSTLAAIIDLINETKYYHIVTIEDPIEFLHSHKNCTIHQRELHSDTPSFAIALRAALRQAPKVILVGEMRDLETIEVALEAAETGHLVLSTLHTIDASKTIDRIIGVFPKNEERAIRTRIAQSFRYIVSQRLIPRPDGKGRIAAIEILKSTMRTREYIEKGESEGKSLLDAMDQGDLDGMQTFDGVIEHMVRTGVLTQEGAMPYATNANNLLLRLGDLGGQAPVPTPPASSKDENSMLDMIER
ncbi:MAG TPA: twitching motility protein [Blastocatellia bacterium]|jgi:twitching motility protein PilT|nr:twitching motility protein [Blastocatellia bacterium]HAF25404.1 twitching motility protein [Blastocatellia bacterium]